LDVDGNVDKPKVAGAIKTNAEKSYSSVNNTAAPGASNTKDDETPEKQLCNHFSVPVTIQAAIYIKDSLIRILGLEEDDLKISIRHVRTGLAGTICQNKDPSK
jgi:hypothetical protein